MPVTIAFTGVREFEAAVTKLQSNMAAATRAAVAEAGHTIQAAAQGQAPVVTGTLRRSIRTRPLTSFGMLGWETDVGPTVVYGRRVELGFHGNDALGRAYSQDGQPYLAPAFADVAPELALIFQAHWRRAML